MVALWNELYLGGDQYTNGWNINFNNTDGLADANGNLHARYLTTASAVNYLDFTNAATGNDYAIAAAGSDTNIGIDIQAKGTGEIQVDGFELPRVLSRDVSATTVNNSTSETTVFTYSVPANTLRTDKTLRVSSIMEILNNSGGNVVFTFRDRDWETLLSLR